MALYIIAIGGTGAKCVEAVAHVAAAGLLTKEPIRILFVDQDESNGNVTRARKTLETYKSCYELLKDNRQKRSWMQTSIEIIGEVWSAVTGENQTLGNFFRYNSYKYTNSKLGNLFDVLYTEEDRETSLEDGFRGRPALGSAVMSQLNLNQEPWSSLLQQINAVQGGQVTKVFLCGSVFGGTGASGLPTIARLIANQLGDKVKLGGLLMLPYFTFPVPPEQEANEIYARPEQFLLNTEVALRYYRAQSKNKAVQTADADYLPFDAIYLLGIPELSQVSSEFSLGRSNQINEPHFVELYAALAVRHFLVKNSTDKVMLISRNDSSRVIWNDLPDKNTVKQNLISTTRFAFVWTANIVPELNLTSADIKEFHKRNPWFEKFFKTTGFLGSTNLPDLSNIEQQNALLLINNWCESYLRWLGALHASEPGIQLFNRSAFYRNGQILKSTGNFANLVADSSVGASGSQQDTVQSLKNKLNPNDKDLGKLQGAVGLAQALYKQCQ